MICPDLKMTSLSIYGMSLIKSEMKIWVPGAVRRLYNRNPATREGDDVTY